MNNLITRDFHEAIGKVITIEMNDDVRLGNALLDKIPTTQVQDLKDNNINTIEVSDLYTL